MSVLDSVTVVQNSFKFFCHDVVCWSLQLFTMNKFVAVTFFLVTATNNYITIDCGIKLFLMFWRQCS